MCYSVGRTFTGVTDGWEIDVPVKLEKLHYILFKCTVENRRKTSLLCCLDDYIMLWRECVCQSMCTLM